MAKLSKFAPLGLLLVLSGCAGMPAGDSFAERRVTVDTLVLRADLALQLQDFGRAIALYHDAARRAEDPELAERAAEIAYQTENNRAGVLAAETWQALAPDDQRPRQFLAFFALQAGQTALAVEHFRALVETSGNSDTALGAVAESLAAEADAATATTVMRSLTEHFPDSPRGHYGLARLALAAGQFTTAAEAAATAARLAPGTIAAELLQARALMLAGQSEAGLALAAALAEQHDTLEVQLQYAELLLSAGRSEEAEQRLNAILEVHPGLPEAIRALGFLAMTQNDQRRAEEHFTALRGDARYRDEAFYYLGRIAENRGQHLQATRSYARVVQGSHAIEAQLRTARILLQEMGDETGALRHLREFGANNVEFRSDMLLAEAQLLLQLERPEDALDLLATAVEETPEDESLEDAHAQVYVIAAQAAADRGEAMAAAELIDRGLAAYPANTSLRYARVLQWQREGRLRRAVTGLEELVADNPDNPTLLNALGYLLTDELGRHEEARTYIQQALALEPDNAAIIDSMGWVLYHLGELTAARDYLERAYRLVDDPEIVAHLVQTRLDLGQRDDALQLLEEGLAAHPESPHLLELKRRLGR